MYSLIWIKLAFIVYSWMYFVSCDFTNDWHYDVYTGRHFNELVTSPGSDIVEKPAVLILYGPECVLDAIRLKDLARPWGPPDKYMTLAFHDYVLYGKRIWYEVDDMDNLQERYMTSDEDKCIAALYFALGSRLSAEPVRFDLQSDFYEFIWRYALIQVTVQNALSFRVKLKMAGQGDGSHLAVCDRFETVKVSVHISMCITVYSDSDHRSKDLLYYHVVEPYSPLTPLVLTVDLVKDFKKTLSTNWLMEWRDKLDEESAQVYKQQMYTASRYNVLLHQPLTVYKHTETGYKKMMLPESVFTLLKDYYRDYTESSLREGSDWSEQLSIATSDSQEGQMVLPKDVQDRVLDYIKQTVEEWCECVLEWVEGTTSMSQYQTGNYISSHVAESTFTALIQIEDYGSETPWPLEVIDFSGQRKALDLTNGEVLLYEASSVVFARPLPYLGQLYTCLYVDLAGSHDQTADYDYVLNGEADVELEEDEDGLRLDSEVVKDEL